MKGKDVASKPYAPRGIVIDRLAREKKSVRGQKAIALFLKAWVEEMHLDPKLAVSDSTIGNYLLGNTAPHDDWITLFTLAFELDKGEMAELAFSHSFRTLTAA